LAPTRRRAMTNVFMILRMMLPPLAAERPGKMSNLLPFLAGVACDRLCIVCIETPRPAYCWKRVQCSANVDGRCYVPSRRPEETSPTNRRRGFRHSGPGPAGYRGLACSAETRPLQGHAGTATNVPGLRAARCREAHAAYASLLCSFASTEGDGSIAKLVDVALAAYRKIDDANGKRFSRRVRIADAARG
jgi:hypothetical protein